MKKPAGGKQANVRRIAVLGGNNAGKTVFITSLVDNLQHFDPEKLKLGDEWDVLDAQITNEGKMAGLDRFPQEMYRQKLFAESPLWPRKTYSTSIACLDVRLKRREPKWYRRDVVARKLEIVDIAGERTADFGMIKRTFREWSMMVTNQLAGAGIEWERILREQTSTSGDDRNAILNRYRDVLKELYARGANASMTPSTARITAEGKPIDGSPEEYRKTLQEHPVGLKDKEFAPLPESAFGDRSLESLAREFEAAYDEYKSAIVEPIWDWLKRADDIIYLVDVTGVLANGTPAYNAELDLAKGCFHAICNTWRLEESIIKKGREWLRAKMEGRHFSRLIAVATKADLVHRDFRDDITELARKLLESSVRNCGFDKMECTYCAAVCADLEAEETARLPDKWDEDWSAGKYVFAHRKSPLKMVRRDIPPKSIHLGAIARMLLQID